MTIDRTPEDELKEQIRIAFMHTTGIPNKTRAEEGVEYHTLAGRNRFFELVMQIVFADREAQATALLEGLPRNLDMLDLGELGGPTGRKGFSTPAVTYRNGYNEAISEVRSIIKEQLS